ncbi:hypothetical protein [Colwellia sp. Bg11-28]|uniref:hypothetical protein n=1 Tax=Colwellia sp. Bg11-28 TaxID=2058305 RepID=UPI000C33A9EC|nr:hypothetical protein [Colwellia sp. Bg11-28]PKH85478.1 hypothetical protein CXF79_19650 [Colwellia sp. Bg11-28]
MNERTHVVELNFNDAEIKLLREAGSLSFNSLEIYMRLSLLEKAERDLTRHAFREQNKQRLNRVLNTMNSIREVKQYFTDEELAYLLPLLKKWCSNESEIVNWLNTYKIPACANKTPCDLYKSGKKELFLQYIKHIEIGGFE